MHTEVCPTCGAGVKVKMRSMPSMATCNNGHTYDRKYSMSEDLYKLVGPVTIPKPTKAIELSVEDWKYIFDFIGNCVLGPDNGPRGATENLFNAIKTKMPHVEDYPSTIQTKPYGKTIFIQKKDFT